MQNTFNASWNVPNILTVFLQTQAVSELLGLGASKYKLDPSNKQ